MTILGTAFEYTQELESIRDAFKESLQDFYTHDTTQRQRRLFVQLAILAVKILLGIFQTVLLINEKTGEI